ncbi:hypothetical protein H0N95_01030 [Candidatus Micrarchaeota archaeon]|nr:hypothetical protein [Candidatus Micrarchaeota archaeon]
MGLLKNKTTAAQETMLAKRYVIDIVIGSILDSGFNEKGTSLKPQQHENISRILTDKISDKEVDKIFEEFKKNPKETIAGHISGWIQKKKVFERIKQEEISRALK